MKPQSVWINGFRMSSPYCFNQVGLAELLHPLMEGGTIPRPNDTSPWGTVICLMREAHNMVPKGDRNETRSSSVAENER
jgi:hypothetical protein